MIGRHIPRSRLSNLFSRRAYGVVKSSSKSWCYNAVAVTAGAGAMALVLTSQRQVQCWSFWQDYELGVEPGKESTLLSQAPITGKKVLPSEVDLVLFHGGCPDGFAAAFAAYLVRGNKCEYVGIGHGQGKRLPDNVDGKQVALLDFSFDRETMEELLNRAKGVIVLDHHASAQEALVSMPDEAKVFEMKQSGATLAWDFFHGTKKCPLLFRYIEDRDIWRWSLRRSKEFSASQDLEIPVPAPGRLDNPDVSFAPWKKLYDGGHKSLDSMISKGSSIVAYQEKLVSQMARSARVRRLKEAPHLKAYVVDGSVLASELGNHLSLMGIDNDIVYAAVVNYKPGKVAGEGMWTVSLRSLHGSHDGAADVSQIAKKYGGGGHRAASGAAFKVRDLEEIFVPEPNTK